MDQIRQTMGGQNWLGMWTLYSREVRRFIKVGGQTVIAPIITALMFLAVFAVAFGGGREIGGVPYVEFLAPGLIMMSILQNAFANTSSSLMMAKLNDNIIDTLMPPLSAGELTVGFAFGGVTRGVLVAGLAMAALMPLAGSRIHDPFYIIYYGVSAALMLSLLGIITAIWAKWFDHVAIVTGFVILPLSFLSGSFYSVERLTPAFLAFTKANPFFYIIDGFRYGFTGQAESQLLTGILMVAAVNLVLWAICWAMFATGYKLKA